MIVHLVDGTYELYRHFYGLRRFTKDKGRPMGAVAGVLNGQPRWIGADQQTNSIMIAAYLALSCRFSLLFRFAMGILDAARMSS